MTTKAQTIAALNDAFRRNPFDGKVIIAGAFAQANPVLHWAAITRVRAFSDFNEDNDPHGEHDFGAFDLAGEKMFWKIDYYDRASFEKGQEFGAEDPSDPETTLRFLTIFYASDY